MATNRRRRIENALWGLFAGDALAMPAHWFYGLENIRGTFDGGITDYGAAPHPHPESFMVGMGYHPDIEKAKDLGRPYDILHEHARFYETNYSTLEIKSGERESEHGNATPSLKDRYHYHHGLKAGENTVAAGLARVLMRTVIGEGRYDEQAFIRGFIDYFVTPGERHDPYLEIYLRAWFENYSKGSDPRSCAEHQRAVWSIGSHGGMIRPMVLSLLAPTSYQGLGFAVQHQNLTHRSENVAAGLGVTVPLLHDLIGGKTPLGAATDRSKEVRAPGITGEELHRTYRDHGGPGNIPTREMWDIHTKLSDEIFDLESMVAENEIGDVVLKKFGTACYPEHGLPLLLFIAAKQGFDPTKALLSNANAGGDNVHRGAVLGLLVGAAQDEFPGELVEGLAEKESLSGEIAAFAKIAAGGAAW